MTKIIGLTGVIGSGKSTVARLLSEFGAVVIDADKLGHEAFQPGTEAWREVIAAFGRQVLSPSGEIDRNKLGDIVFNDTEALGKLNRIMHPRIYEMVSTLIDEYHRQNVAVVVLEVPLLIEANWTSLVDEVWVTIAPRPKILERIRNQRGLNHKETMVRIHSQLPVKEILKHANAVINNERGLEELKNRVNELWAGLVSDAK